MMIPPPGDFKNSFSLAFKSFGNIAYSVYNESQVLFNCAILCDLAELSVSVITNVKFKTSKVHGCLGMLMNAAL